MHDDTFSLCCLLCDDGLQYDCELEAIAAGWREIEADPEGLSWTYLGVCPECGVQWFDDDLSRELLQATRSKEESP